MSARSRDPSDHLVPFFDQVLELEFGVRKRAPVHRDQLLDTFRPGKLATRCGWIMGSAAGSDKLIHELELALVPDLMDVGTSQFLQVFSHRWPPCELGLAVDGEWSGR